MTPDQEPQYFREAVALMDHHYPGWDQKIDLTILNLLSIEDCILRQTDKTLFWGENIVRLVGPRLDDPELECRRCDIALFFADDLLRYYWEDEIMRRRRGATA